MLKLYNRIINVKSAKEILRWSYEKPYDFYNNAVTAAAIEEMISENFRVIYDREDRVIGFYCTGPSAQVPAGHDFGVYEENALDIGLGMHPEHTGKGFGYPFCSYILEEIRKNHQGPLRLSVAKFNQRAIHLYEKLGFEIIGEFKTPTTEFYTMLLRDQ